MLNELQFYKLDPEDLGYESEEEAAEEEDIEKKI